MIKFTALCVIAFSISFSCTTNPDLGKFDNNQWKKDKNGCLGIRSGQLDNLLEVKDNLLNVSESEIRLLLGVPDKINLYTRGQKFLIYYIDPTTDCNQQDSDGSRKLVLRASSINTIKAVTIEN